MSGQPSCGSGGGSRGDREQREERETREDRGKQRRTTGHFSSANTLAHSQGARVDRGRLRPVLPPRIETGDRKGRGARRGRPSTRPRLAGRTLPQRERERDRRDSPCDLPCHLRAGRVGGSRESAPSVSRRVRSGRSSERAEWVLVRRGWEVSEQCAGFAEQEKEDGERERGQKGGERGERAGSSTRVRWWTCGVFHLGPESRPSRLGSTFKRQGHRKGTRRYSSEGRRLNFCWRRGKGGRWRDAPSFISCLRDDDGASPRDGKHRASRSEVSTDPATESCRVQEKDQTGCPSWPGFDLGLLAPGRPDRSRTHQRHDSRPSPSQRTSKGSLKSHA